MNKVIETGKILNIESFKTKKDNFAINLQLESYSKYGDVISCVAYGFLAESIIKKSVVGDEVILIGRLMSLQLRDSNHLTMKVVIEEIAKCIISSEELNKKNV